MSAQNFRSAFNGFNREDVVHYIEYLNAKHTAEINQLHSDIDLLQAKVDSAAQDTALQEQLAAAESARDDYKNQLDDALTKIAELENAAGDTSLSERCTELEAQLQDSLAARDAAIQKAATCQVEQELEAYRRAERTERIARQRAEKVYHQANGALADATAKVDEASAQITEVTDKVSSQLALLQQAVTTSKQALADAAATLYTIRPGSTEE